MTPTLTDEQLDQRLALDASPGPALPIAEADADALIEAALVGAGFGPAGGPGSAGGAARGVRIAGSVKVAFGIVVVIVFVIAVLIGRHRAHHAAVAPIDAPPDVAGGPGSAPAPVPPLDAAPASLPVEAAPAPVEDAGAEPEDIDTEPAPKAHHATEPRAVNDLLGEANARRAAHEWRESDALYARVVKRVPGTLAAQTALVASASLHLEHLGDPRGAAERFKRALAIAPDAALAEDARWGLAEAARARHDVKAEAKALDDFLAHHPGSPLAGKARARREELK